MTPLCRLIPACFLFWTLPGLSSCSLPLGPRNLGLGYHSTNPANNTHSRIVLGVDIQSQPSAGTTIGWSETTLLNPSSPMQSTDIIPRSGFQFPLAWRWNDSQGTNHTLGWSLSPVVHPNPDCHFIHLRRTGLSTGYDQSQRGFNFGSISGTILRANPNLNAAYQLSYHSSIDGEKKLTTLMNNHE